MEIQRRCIYCNSEGPFNKEHPLPRGLGEFKYSPLLYDKVCVKCNGEISKLEDQFCHCGPEGYFKAVQGILGRLSHKNINVFERGSFGGKPIDMVAPHPKHGIPVLWQLDGENSVNEVRQIVLIPENGEPQFLRIQTWMKEPQQLQKAISDLKLVKSNKHMFMLLMKIWSGLKS